jgi:hypothetical protein
MKKFAFTLMAIVSMSLLSFSGCGGHDSKVIEAPATDEPAMSEAEQAALDKGMEEQMNQQGN